MRLDGVRKNSSGYAVSEWVTSGDLIDLLVGSEGTLALFVAVECRLAPAPAATATVLAAFDTLEQAVEAAIGAREAGASACELLDRTFLDMVRSGHSTVEVPGDCDAVLLAGVEAKDAATARAIADAVATTFREAGAGRTTTATDADDQASLWALRHAASPTITKLFPRLASMQFIEDGCVPPAHFAAYVRGVRAILDRHALPGVIFGHAGDAHAHVNPLVDVHAAGWRALVTTVFDETVALVRGLGGTLAGEHGDGRLRAPALATIWSVEAVEAFQAVKLAFDPAGVLNPGVIIPDVGRAPFETVKYDPQAPALPPRARAVLDAVASGRRYADYRLAMLDALPAAADGSTTP
jgi:FAD/FMN-containing dehydrogenase